MARINTDVCTVCGGCIDLCPTTAICMINDTVVVNADICSGCKICVNVCPVNASVEEE